MTQQDASLALETTADRRPPAGRTGALALRNSIGWLILGGIVLLLYHSVLWQLIAQWWIDENYSHGFLVPLFSAFVIWENRDRLRQVPAQPTWRGLVVLLVSLGVLFVGTAGAELFLTRTSLLGVMAGLVLFFSGWPMLKQLAYPFGVLLLMIPIPAIIYNQIVFPLQLLASQLATTCLQVFHLVPVVREGNILILPSTQLEVAEACSGIRSLMSMLTLGVFYGYFAERKNWIRILICLAIVPIAVFSNALRVIFAAVAAERWGESATEGLAHLTSGIVLFLVATLTMIGFHLLVRAGVRLWKGTAPAPGASSPLQVAAAPAGAGSRETEIPVPAPDFREDFLKKPALATGTAKAWRLGMVVAILLGCGAVIHYLDRGLANLPLAQPLHNVPIAIEGWQGFDVPLAPRIIKAAGVDDYLNRAYQQDAGAALGLYVGYYSSQRTGDAIHSPRNCLPGGGWQPVSAKYVSFRRPDGQTAQINEYIIEKQGQREIVFYWYQSHGRIIASEYWAKLYMVWDAMRLNRTDGALVRIDAPITGSEPEVRQRTLRFTERVFPALNQIIPK
jgi:EpsI family protein